jgi:hypothetical protein
VYLEVSRRLLTDIFTFWPPERSSGELECYYAPLCKQLVDILVAVNSAVWPVYKLPNQFGGLKGLVVAPPTEREGVLQHYQEKVDETSRASETDKGLLLDYLLSTKNISNIRGLPLVRG